MNEYCTLDIHDYTVLKNEQEVDCSRLCGGLCITAVHTAIPYVTTFLHEGSFPWEADNDAVFASCPTGQVDLEIRKLDRNELQIRVADVHGECPKHQAGDTFTFNGKDQDLDVVDAIFPVLLFLSNHDTASVSILDIASGSKMLVSNAHPSRASDDTELLACELEQKIKESQAFIDVVGMKRSCKYHRRARSYKQADLVPGNMCGFAYHALYPTILSMLYNGKMSDQISLPCPGTKNNVLFLIERTPKPGKFFLDLAERILRLLKTPMDIITMNVSISVTQNTGKCLEKMKVGERFPFGNKRLFCASSFDNLLGILVYNSIANVPCDHVFQCTSKACRIQYKVRTGS